MFSMQAVCFHIWKIPTEKFPPNNQEVADEEKSFIVLFGLFSNQLAQKPAVFGPYLENTL
jgi:hypothetical protein